MQMLRDELMPGVYLTCLRTGKFKTGLLSVNFLTRLCREDASANTLIPNVLRRGTARFPDMDALAARLDGLYGARVEPIARKLGEIQAVGFWADFVDEAYLPEDGRVLLEDAAELVGELILRPNLRGGLFLSEYVDSEREKLLEDIRARVNDKIAYSRFRLTELMCAAEDYAADVLGTVETAEEIDHASLTRRYERLLASSPVEIFYCGTAEPARVRAALQKALADLPRGELDDGLGTDIRLNALEDTPRRFTETMDVTQAKLAVGFRLGPCMEDPDIAAIRVMNTVYGGGVSSKLFMNVREKLSLCYFASSGVDIMKGVMLVISGVEPENRQKALDEILRQLDDVKNGKITDEELGAARTALASELMSLSDSAGQLESFWLSQNLLGLDCGPDELAALVGEVTRQDVARVAAGVECDMIYFMLGEEADAHAEN